MSRIQIRRGTAAQWTAANPTLYAGEFGYETDTNKVKLGNGTTAWTALAYVSLEYDTFAGLTATLTNKTISGSTNTITNIGISSLAVTGTPGSSTYLRGDGTWATISNGTFADTAFTLQDDGDATKQVKFQLSGVTTGTTRTLTVPDKSSTLEVTANKGQAGGYASLDENGYIPLSQWGAQVLDGGSAASSTTDVIDGGSA